MEWSSFEVGLGCVHCWQHVDHTNEFGQFFTLDIHTLKLGQQSSINGDTRTV